MANNTAQHSQGDAMNGSALTDEQIVEEVRLLKEEHPGWSEMEVGVVAISHVIFDSTLRRILEKYLEIEAEVASYRLSRFGVKQKDLVQELEQHKKQLEHRRKHRPTMTPPGEDPAGQETTR